MDFTYENYRSLIRSIKALNVPTDFADDLKDRFILMRHDVEFSVERAHRMAKLEVEEDFKTSYFFQITNTYNSFSKKNAPLIREIAADGHKIGLHFDAKSAGAGEDIKELVKRQVKAMQDMLGIAVDRFSAHRPFPDLIKNDLSIKGLLNAYDKKFFTYLENGETDEPREVFYISDSCHQWNYGIPTPDFLRMHKKIQILIHPYTWTETGVDNIKNLKTLMKEKEEEMIDTFASELRHFGEIKDAF